jgi:hypothetical protein
MARNGGATREALCPNRIVGVAMLAPNSYSPSVRSSPHGSAIGARVCCTPLPNTSNVALAVSLSGSQTTSTGDSGNPVNRWNAIGSPTLLTIDNCPAAAVFATVRRNW